MKFKDMNLPNKLTTIRMFCVPLMLVLFIIHMLYRYLGFNCDINLINSLTLLQLIMVVIFIFASITDFIDGHLARKHNIVSDYGKLMDPLADKLLVNTTIICMLASTMYLSGNDKLIYFEIIAMMFSILVIARDIFVDALRMQALKNNVVVPANMLGKLKTATLMPGIAFMLIGGLHLSIFIIGLSLMTLGGLFALIGGIKYYKDLSKHIKE